MSSSGDLDSNNKIHCMLFEKKNAFTTLSSLFSSILLLLVNKTIIILLTLY